VVEVSSGFSFSVESVTAVTEFIEVIEVVEVFSGCNSAPVAKPVEARFSAY
jgi:hypothetical protein